MASGLEERLAIRLRVIAAKKRIPLSKVADRAGLARSYMWTLLDGQSSATLAVVQRLAAALSIDPLALLTEGDHIQAAQAYAHPLVATALVAESQTVPTERAAAKLVRNKASKPGAVRRRRPKP